MKCIADEYQENKTIGLATIFQYGKMGNLEQYTHCFHQSAPCPKDSAAPSLHCPTEHGNT